MASVKQLSERKFKITISNGYHPDGRKISTARTITVPDSISKKRIAQFVAHEAVELERVFKSGFAEYGEMSFERYSLLWLKRQTKYASGTLESYRRALKVVYPYIGSIQVNKLRPMALENMLHALRQRKHRGNFIKEATVQKYLSVVSAVLSDAKRNEIIQRNPARMIDLPATVHTKQFIPTPDEAKHLLDDICNIPYVFTVFYALAIFTGCRRGELCALKWTDICIHPDFAVITVSRSRSSVPGKGVVEGSTKSGHSREVLINSEMVGVLEALYSQKLDEAEAGNFELGEYIFTNEYGELIHPDTFSKRLRRLYDENGFPREYHLHTLRHYYVSSLLHGGVDKQTVADLAGHGDTSFLERVYCHPQLELKQAAADTIFYANLHK